MIARGGGSLEDLLPFSNETLRPGRGRVPHPGGQRDRARGGHAPARPGRRRPRLHPHRRRQAGSCPDVRRADRRPRPGRAPAAARRVRRGSTASSAGSAALRARPVLADPGACVERSADEVDEARRPRSPGASPGPARRAADEVAHLRGPGPGAVAAGHPGARVRRGAAARTARCVRDPAEVAAGDRLRVRLARGELTAEAGGDTEPPRRRTRCGCWGSASSARGTGPRPRPTRRVARGRRRAGRTTRRAR